MTRLLAARLSVSPVRFLPPCPLAEEECEPGVLPPAERINQATHAFGLLLATLAAVALFAAATRASLPAAAGAVLFGTSLIALYAASTLSHSFTNARRRTFWRMVDQIAILGLGVGSFAPFVLVHAADARGLTIFGLMAASAVVFAVLRVRLGERGLPPAWIGVIGWLPALLFDRLYAVGGPAGFGLVAAGALLYTGGVYFLLNDARRVWYHGVWHGCTVAASACHFAFLYGWCVPTAA